MAFAIVPIAPGVPPIPRDPAAAPVPTPQLVTSDATDLQPAQPVQWGLFSNGAAVVTAESVISFAFKRDWVVADYQVEQGAFESYDKVELPFDVRLRFSAGGDDDARQSLLDSIDGIAGTTNLFDAVTPEHTYESVNVTHYDYRRTHREGVGLLIIDVWCVEVRVNATQQFTQTKTPSGSDPVSTGAVQTQPAGDVQQGVVDNTAPPPTVGSSGLWSSPFGPGQPASGSSGGGISQTSNIAASQGVPIPYTVEQGLW